MTVTTILDTCEQCGNNGTETVKADQASLVIRCHVCDYTETLISGKSKGL